MVIASTSSEMVIEIRNSLLGLIKMAQNLNVGAGKNIGMHLFWDLSAPKGKNRMQTS